LGAEKILGSYKKALNYRGILGKDCEENRQSFRRHKTKFSGIQITKKQYIFTQNIIKII